MVHIQIVNKKVLNVYVKIAGILPRLNFLELLLQLSSFLLDEEGGIGIVTVGIGAKVILKFFYQRDTSRSGLWDIYYAFYTQACPFDRKLKYHPWLYSYCGLCLCLCIQQE